MPRSEASDDPEHEQEEEEEQEEQEEQEEEPQEEPESEKGEDAEEEPEEEEPEFQYSRCSGNKKALLVGINYFGGSAPLNGCINDVQNVHRFITENWGYEEDNIKVLTDDAEDEELRPTKANILEAMSWLVEGASEDDALFFHYSGHGSQQEDEDGDEHDGVDEAICPVDCDENGLIIDDTIHDLLVKPLPIGCRLTVIFDCCHSGSALDLPYMYSADGTVKEHNRLLDAKRHILEAAEAQAQGDLDGIVKSIQKIGLAASGESEKAHQVTLATRSSPADVVFLSGCKDHQTSADAEENGEATGALSFALLETLTENPQQTYQELLLNIRTILQEKYSQKPQLSSSHHIDTNLNFIL